MFIRSVVDLNIWGRTLLTPVLTPKSRFRLLMTSCWCLVAFWLFCPQLGAGVTAAVSTTHEAAQSSQRRGEPHRPVRSSRQRMPEPDTMSPLTGEQRRGDGLFLSPGGGLGGFRGMWLGPSKSRVVSVSPNGRGDNAGEERSELQRSRWALSTHTQIYIYIYMGASESKWSSTLEHIHTRKNVPATNKWSLSYFSAFLLLIRKTSKRKKQHLLTSFRARQLPAPRQLPVMRGAPFFFFLGDGSESTPSTARLRWWGFCRVSS